MSVSPFRVQADVLRVGAEIRDRTVRAIDPKSPHALAHEQAVAAGRSDIMDRPVFLADLWTRVAAEQIRATATMIDQEDPGFVLPAMSPLVRSVIEHSTATTWILDEQVAGEIRAARAALYFYRGMEDAVKTAAHLGGAGNKRHLEAKKQFREFRKVLAKEFQNDTNLDVSPIVISGEKFPTPMGPVLHHGGRWGDQKQWEGVYDYLWGAGNHPNLMAVELLEDTKGLIDRFCQAMISPYFHALCYYAQYCGFPDDDLARYLTLVQETWPGDK